ncbi:barstar family protein, partial [Nocardia sp. CWNU-33]|uniref:barstar family protein n=1 Tax=Nocardia sp. CWNU-33 TaxID=3392117 RepID=UPI00398EA684
VGLAVLIVAIKWLATMAMHPPEPRDNNPICSGCRRDGALVSDEQKLFEQMNGRLRLPVYFGWNWNALSDCLRNMGWAPADHYLLVIERSALMLQDCPEDREVFLGILDTAGRYWGHSMDCPGKSFNSLLL